MIGFSTLNELFNNILRTGIVNKVYHSVMLKPIDGGGNKPAAPVQGRWVYVGLNDTQGFSCYVRQTGSADVISTNRVGGCNKKIYRFQVPTRIVFYNDSEKRSHETLIGRLAGAIMKTGYLNVQKIITNPDEILRSEAPTGKFSFKEDTFFVAIDCFVLLDIQSDTCPTEITCEGIENPVCLPKSEAPGCTIVSYATNFVHDTGEAPAFEFKIFRNGEEMVSRPTPDKTNGSFTVNEGDTIEIIIGHTGNFAIYNYAVFDNTGQIDANGNFSGYLDTTFGIVCGNGPYLIRANM